MIAAILISIFVLLALLNYVVILSNVFHKSGSSLIFLFGGLLGAVGFYLNPSLRGWAWLPLLLEPATLMFLFVLPRLLVEAWGTSRFNRLCVLMGNHGALTARLCLYYKQIFILIMSVSRPPGEVGVVGMSRIGDWRIEPDRLLLTAGESTAIFDSVHTASGSIAYRCREAIGFDIDSDVSLIGMIMKLEAGSIG